MKDLRVKKRNIDIAYNKAIGNLIEDINRELVKLCKERKGSKFDLKCYDKEVYWKNISLSQLDPDTVWTLYLNIFNELTFDQ